MVDRCAVAVRPARPADLATLAAIWAAGWTEVHADHVPEALHRHRTAGALLPLLDAVLDRIHTATDGRAGSPVGFALVNDDEVEHLYVDPASRGAGAAAALLAAAERTIHADHAVAWLAVVPSNTRARTFYERHGWTDHGPIGHGPVGPEPPEAITVDCHRYEKPRPPTRPERTS